MPGCPDDTPRPAVSPGRPTAERRRLDVRGRVQGVGFRPFVYRIATELGLAGHVGNDPRGVFIEIEGRPETLDRFRERFHAELPPLARVSSVDVAEIPALDEREFVMRKSALSGEQKAEVSPDVATCADCLREMTAPSDRRHRYPFINCTNCGPRYSIIREVPYDRPGTTMKKFPMCPECRREYGNPADRRFHAQPNACPVCGPRVWLADAEGGELEGDGIRLAAGLIREGGIVAVKGLGGFHLACRADLDEAVLRLRERKSREAKPFAVMVGSLEEARGLVCLDDVSERALTSWQRPIVLAPERRDCPVSRHVAPASGSLGVMLPYTPLHHLLFDRDMGEGLGPLVMTSANPSDEPLCAGNAEAVERLSGIADAFLLHDRDIERRVDDSVVIAVAKPEPLVVPLRRSRGYVPAPVAVPLAAPEPVLAVGGEMKSTVCILSDREAVLSEHLGELSNAAAFRNFVSAIGQLRRLLRLDPGAVAHDLHPGYASTQYARRLGLRALGIQHHHAHVVGCMAENGLTGRAVGIAADGTGYGTDGAVWGCEVLVCDEAGFERAGHLAYYPLVGGDAAALETWRPAAGLLEAAFGRDWPSNALSAFGRVPGEAAEVTRKRLEAGAGVETSSLGRLFDGVAFLLGVCDRNRFDAEAAMSLETLAAKCGPVEPFPFTLHAKEGAPVEIDHRPLVRAVLEGLEAGRPAAQLARAFHETVALALADCAERACRSAALGRVCLSGGCFANRLLLERVSDILAARGREVHVHRRVPTGDGGIALGQAVSAAARLSRGAEEVA